MTPAEIRLVVRRIRVNASSGRFGHPKRGTLRVLREPRIYTIGLIALMNGCASEPSASRAGILVAAISSDPGHLNPAITTNGGVHTAADLLYNGLVGLDSNAKPIPELALRWEVEEQGAVYRFHLRPDVRWHDGRPFTSADVKYTFDEVLLRFHARARASLSPALSAVEALDPLTVAFRFRRPYAPFLQQLDVVEAPILPKHLFEGTDPLKNPANLAPVGTGPFRFVAYTPGAEIRYRANLDYFGSKPALSDVVLRVIPDRGTQVAALEAGEVDWLFGVPGPLRAALRRNPAIRFLQTSLSPGGSDCITTLAFNLDRPALRDVRVRRAIAHSIDRRLFLERVTFGEGRVAETSISSEIGFAHAPDLKAPAYDPAEARRLLGTASRERLTLGFTFFPTDAGYGNLLRAQLADVGIDVSLHALEAPVLVQAVFVQRDFDMALIPYCNGTDPEIGVRRMFVSSSIAPVPFSNAAGYRSNEMDALFEKAATSLDQNERGRSYRRIQELGLKDLPYLPLIETENTRAYAARCAGFVSSSHFAAAAHCGP